MIELWLQVLGRLADELPEQQVNTWLRPLQAVEREGTLRLLAPNRYAVDWVKQNVAVRIATLFRELYGADVAVTIETGSTAPAPTPAAAAAAEPVRTGFGRRIGSEPAVQVGVKLNPESTFDTFVEGKSNHFAKAAAMQVAENPGKAYNPLFIYGGTGLGAIRRHAWPMCIRSASSTTWCRRYVTTP
jgi:chromosomal replication initiator protein